MAKILSQEIDPNEKLDNLLKWDNVVDKADLKDVKWNLIVEKAFDDIMKNPAFQEEILAIYKKEGKWDLSNKSSLDQKLNEYFKL